MNLLSVKDLSKMGRESALFSNVTFGLDEGCKAALIGRNGTGKSTLLNCIAGIITADNGTAIFNKDAGVSYLSQNPEFNPEHTIREHIFSSESPKLSIIRKYEELCSIMADPSLSEKNNLPTDSLQKEFDDISNLMTEKNLWTYEAEISSILTVLGIASSKKSESLDRQLKTLSGGMIKKVALAQVLVEDSKLLLLDEPTNHLDITTISWLEEYLQKTNKSVLMVTHDRYFLDSVCSDIYELEHGKFSHYKGNFSTYLEKKATELEIAQNTERRIESVLRTERDWLMRGPCARGTKARARTDNINRLINRDKLTTDKSFSFEVAGRRLGGKILEIKNISKNYPKAATGEKITPVISNFSYIFKKGQRIGVFGDNGSGKSTFLNIITGTIESDSGTIEKGVNTVFAYYQQNPSFKDTSLTVLEYIKEQAEFITTNDGKNLTASQMLEQFAFEGKIQYSPVSSLSGGERKRLFLVRLLMSNPNFLVLDEPTNDFDIFTMSIFESFLETFAGCILVVSHDRYFMDKVADTLFILEEDSTISGYVGKCSEYIQYRKELFQEKNAIEKENTQNNSKQKNNEKSNTLNNELNSKPRRRTFKEQKEFENIETEIFELEDRKTELETLMSSGQTDSKKLLEYNSEYQILITTLPQKYERWETLGQLSDY